MKRQNAFLSSFKRKRRKLTLEEKIGLLDRLKRGERTIELSRKFDMSESALRAIQRNEEQLRQFASRCTKEALQYVSYMPRNAQIDQTEQLVFSWYEEERKQRAPTGTGFTIVEICAKARQIYEKLRGQSADDEVEEAEEDYERREFKASKGWFIKFQKHYNVELKTTLEHATATDEETAEHFQHIITSGDYQQQQVFSAAELSLAWRSLPIAPFKSANDRERLSLLLCSNASGDFVVKPLLVFRTLNPYCLRSRKPEELPVFWRARARDSQCNPRVTPTLLRDWLMECFVPTVRDYLQIMELPERCLLLLDDQLLLPSTATASIQNLLANEKCDDFVRIECVPAVQHPMRPHILSLFNCVYLRRMLEQLNQTVHHAAVLFAKAWRDFSVAAAVNVIAEALEECSADWWNGGWLQLWSEIVHKPLSNNVLMNELQRIVAVANMLPAPGYDGLTVAEIRNHLRLEVTETNEPSAEEALLSIQDADNHNNNDDDNDEEYEVEGDVEEGKQLNTFMKVEALPTLNTSVNHHIRIRSQHNHVAIANQVQMQNINKALACGADLIATVRQVKLEGNDCFEQQLNTLLQPYRELKERILQPTIRQYFQPHN